MRMESDYKLIVISPQAILVIPHILTSKLSVSSIHSFFIIDLFVNRRIIALENNNNNSIRRQGVRLNVRIVFCSNHRKNVE